MPQTDSARQPQWKWNEVGFCSKEEAIQDTIAFLSEIKGKAIADIDVDLVLDNAFGDWEPTEITLSFTDGTQMQVELRQAGLPLEDFPCLGVCLSIPPVDDSR